jgi:FkbM family methyltransferase
LTNPWSGDKLKLNTYRHKSYWYFGRNREASTMSTFKSLIPRDGTVIEVGGHIGYLTQYFSSLVGPKGKVVVFEPGKNNLPYIESNVKNLGNTKLEKLAVSDRVGTSFFYEDSVTGQNNSLSSEYKGAIAVAKSHGETLHRSVNEIETTTIDAYLEKHKFVPDFMKIDVESFELQVLKGMTQALKSVKALMVEVTENHSEVNQILTDNDFELRDDVGDKLDSVPMNYHGNLFAIRRVP